VVSGQLAAQPARFVDGAIFTGHLVGQGVLLAVLYVKGKTRLVWPVLLWLFSIELLALTVLAYHPAWGLLCLAGLGAAMLTLWFAGERYLVPYLWIHPSFWAMQGVFMASLCAWVTVLGWPSVLFFLVAASILIGWAVLPEQNALRREVSL
jgi:hypothetical protein